MSYLDIRGIKNGQWVKPGRGAIDPGTVGGGGGGASTTTPHLPIDMPALTAYLTGGRYVGAHEFPPYPINEGDYWTTTKTADSVIPADVFLEDGDYIQKWMFPPGRGGHETYGGYLRDRLIPRKNKSGLTAEGYRVKDMETEIGWMVEAFYNVTFLEILSNPSIAADGTYNNGQKALCFVKAAKNVAPDYFKIIPMPDGQGSVCDTSTTCADALAKFINTSPTSFLKSGTSYVVAPFGPETVKDQGDDPYTFWLAVKNRLSATYGISIVYWMIYTRDWLGNLEGTTQKRADNLDPIAAKHGRWGSQTPAAANGSGTSERGAMTYCLDTYGKGWVHYWRPQDNRPSTNGSRIFWESGGTELFHYSMMAAIDGGADAVEVTTWNDFYEGSGVGPSLRNGKAWIHLGAFYIARYLTGSWVPVTRDTLFLCHRTQPSSIDTTAEIRSPAQTLFMTNKAPTSEPTRDEIDIACFVTSGTNTEVRVYRDPAGGTNYGATPIQTTAVTVTTINGATITRVKVPLQTGSFKAELWRGATKVYVPGTRVESPEPVLPTTSTTGVVTKPKVQERIYVLASSGTGRA